ncbi:germin-like protein subfamily 1 member 20 [Tripterygium wilfordii]|uniref:germin-like protein subfamily 1 member 20 n=1 Tax=Tripterygium wilfordii TaxID=458696 RepID=UPI0018F84FED|nr:germin-like protein subfamily 1 member 20 [Tripterygium wilfordii]
MERVNTVASMRVATHHFLIIAFVLLALASSLASAYDPSPLQDFCVGVNDTKYGVFVNGKFCKDPNLVTTNDFVFTGLHIPANTSNQLGSNITFALVDQFLGVNTLGVAMNRIDFAPNGGLNPPHYHPRGSEILLVLEGTLYAGFVTSNQDNNRLFAKTLNPGDLIVFPIGLPHFQLNVGNTSAVAIAAFGSHNPGLIVIANAVFGSNPPINPDVLSKAFLLEKCIVEYLQQQFGPLQSRYTG